MHPLLRALSGGDFRSVGRSPEVVKAVLVDPRLFAVLMSGLTAEDALIRMRAADAAEKVTARHPEWLASYKRYLLNEVARSEQQEVRWHAAILFTRLDLTRAERTRVASILKAWLEDKSRIVQAMSLQALADLSKRDPGLRSEVKRVIAEKIKSGPPSVKARGKKLLRELPK
jgi:HEAT repeat protein